MRRALGLALGLGLVLLAAQAASAPVVAPWAIRLLAPPGWSVSIRTDGSGLITYGTSDAGSWSFKAGTIDVTALMEKLKKLPTDRTGRVLTHFLFLFESERPGPDQPGPAHYTRDATVIPTVVAAAIGASDLKDSAQGIKLLEQFPPALPPTP